MSGKLQQTGAIGTCVEVSEHVAREHLAQLHCFLATRQLNHDSETVENETGCGRNVAVARRDRGVRQAIPCKRARPFFLFLHYYDAHSDFAREGDLPYDAPPGFRRFRDEVPSEFDGCSPDGEVCASAWLKRLSDEGTRLPENDRERIRALYAEEVAYTDAMVGRVLRSLRGTGILDRAIVVITSDHGEEFQEHGRFLHESVFEPVVRVPLWIRFPRGEHAGVVDSLAQGIDVAPTILDALGFSIPDAMQGRSLLSIVRGEPSPKRYALIQSLALRTERFKAMPDGGGGRGRLLFDLASDPGETTDVSSRYPEVLEDMERWLVEMMERHDGMAARFGGRVGVTRPVEEADGPAAIPSRRVEMDPHERARLEALGYTVPEGG